MIGLQLNQEKLSLTTGAADVDLVHILAMVTRQHEPGEILSNRGLLVQEHSTIRASLDLDSLLAVCEHITASAVCEYCIHLQLSI